MLLLPPLHPVDSPLLRLGSQYPGEGGGDWGNFHGVGSWLPRCSSSQSPPLLSATSLGSPCVEQGNHELISIQHPFIEHLVCALYMLGCGHIEVNNRVLAFKELQPIKRHGQIIQIGGRTTVEGYRRPRRVRIVWQWVTLIRLVGVGGEGMDCDYLLVLIEHLTFWEMPSTLYLI